MPDAETFRASADAYDRHVGRYGTQLAEALIDFAVVEPGMRGVDVGCGPGALTAVLVGRGGAGRVSAADPSEAFVQACQARLPGVGVVVAAAEELPFADGAFDAALSQLVVNFMRDPEAGGREMARVTRPGGVVASCVWDYAGEMTLVRAFWDAAREIDHERAARADEGVVMRWCRDGELAELWLRAGLRDVRFAPLVVRASYLDFEDLRVAVSHRRRSIWSVLQIARRGASFRPPRRIPPPARSRGRTVRVDRARLGSGRHRPGLTDHRHGATSPNRALVVNRSQLLQSGGWGHLAADPIVPARRGLRASPSCSRTRTVGP